MENQDLEQSILILSRTRRNLSASAPSESNGPNFLDKALAKQISVRQAELDLNLQRCGSVIVRASTPDLREAPCGENYLENSVFEDNHPELSCPTTISQTSGNFSNPLQNFLGYSDTTAPSHPPPIEVQPEKARGLGTPVITRAPLVPWSPSRQTGSLLEILTESASLLHPLFEATSDKQEPNFSTMDMDQSKRNCRKNERKFNQLASLYDLDKNNISWDTMARNRESWTAMLQEALGELVEDAEEMIDDHGDALGRGEVEAWQTTIENAKKTFFALINKFERPNPNGNQPSAAASLPPFQNHNQAQAKRTAKVNINIDADIVEKESKVLSKEIKKFHDSDEATDEEIEAAMSKIDNWNKRFERIKDKVNAIQRNSECFNLNDPKVSNTQAIINNLEQELNVAIDQVKEEDNNRCLYSLANSYQPISASHHTRLLFSCLP